MKKGSTIHDSETALETFLAELNRPEVSSEVKPEVLSLLAPVGFRPVVELQEDGRKKRLTESADSWNPETGEIRVHFERVEESETADQSDTRQVPSPTATIEVTGARRFRPVPISGEPLSATILRDRGPR
jgi:hypothetical protein